MMKNKQTKNQKLTTILLIFLCIIGFSYASSRCEPEEPCSLCMFHPRDCLGCISGYYLLGNECIQCEFPCIECDIPTNQILPKCQDCDADNSGYYLSRGECEACVYPCLTCQRANFCLSCGWEPEKRVSAPMCRCKDGYFEEDNMCKGCPYPCIVCTSPTRCLDCDNINTGLYRESDYTCQPCLYPCLTCATKTICTSCGYDVDKRVEGHPKCICSPGWWDDLSECRSCVKPCIECDSETFCRNCDNENTGLYLLAAEGKCTRCFYPCEKCWGPNNCITCGWDVELRDNYRNRCECVAGYYECGTKCEPCTPPCKRCTSATNCIDCDNETSGKFYFEETENCRQCEYPCINCNTLKQCITCGYGVDKRTPPECDCDDGYYEDGQVCLLCIAPCIKCRSAVKCLDCNSSTSGFYLDGHVCKDCPYPCVNCLSPTHCLTCGWDVEDRIENTVCPCKVGWTEVDEACLPCKSPCVTCINYVTKCTRCIDGYYLVGNRCIQCEFPCIRCESATVCLECGWKPEKRVALSGGRSLCGCLVGYYPVDYDCLPCILPCVTCSGEKQCLTWDCQNETSGLWLDMSQGLCVPCIYPCRTCRHKYQCITCGWDIENRLGPSQDCVCKSGYFHKPEKQKCVTCQHPCVTCTDEFTCQIFNEECNNMITNLYWEVDTCVPCVYPCKACNNPTYCLICANDKENRNLPYCECKTGFYHTHDNLCKPCVAPCVTCNSEAECVTFDCNNDNSGLYLKDGECIPCPYPCDTCYDHSATCKTCGYEPVKRNPPNACGCQHGFYEYAGIMCLKCRPPCTRCHSAKVCVLNYIDCEQYRTGLYHVHQGGKSVCINCEYPCVTCRDRTYCYTCVQDSPIRSTPWCACNDGYYHYNNEICLPCEKPCIKCSSLTQCITLDCIYTTTGLFKQGLECEACQYPCKLCSGGPTNCYECGYMPERRLTPTHHNRSCRCLDTFYELNQECLPCEPPCINCSDKNTCLTIDCRNSETGLYSVREGGLLVCRQCQYPCKTCRNNQPTYCESCGYGGPSVRYDNRYCNCKDGWYELGQECLPCQDPCIKCSSKTVCITLDCIYTTTGLFKQGLECEACQYPCKLCSGGPTNCYECGYMPERRLTPSGSNRSCRCLDTFYELNQECLPCQAPCVNCSDKNTCLTIDCKNSQTGLYSIREGGLLVCRECQYPCATCQNNYATRCTSCSYGPANRVNDQSCRCKDGLYELGQECFPCKKPCVKCSAKNTCITINCENHTTGLYAKTEGGKLVCRECQFPCKTCYDNNPTKCYSCGYGASARNANTVCNCKDGWFAFGQECLRCKSPCTKCSGNATNCVGNSLVCNESAGLFASGGRCHKCAYPCTTCVTHSTNCKICGYGAAARNSAPGCSCRSGYYHIGSAQHCERCQLPCTTCNGAQSCTGISCNAAAGKYTSGLSCINCPFPCATCYGGPSNKCNSCGYGGDRRVAPKTVAYQVQESYRTWYGKKKYRWVTRYREERWCQCRDGYYTQGHECLPCRPPCVKCTSQFACTSIVCDHNKGVYTSGMSCIPCQHPCKNCDGNPRSCRGSVCGFPPERRDHNNNCACKNGFYPEGDDCLPCKIPCTRCSNALNCLAIWCDPSVGVYPSSDGQSCIKCVYPCKTCTSPTYCLSCIDGGVTRQTPACNCKPTWYLKNNECYKCKLPCINCSSEDVCTSYYDCDKNTSGLYYDGTKCAQCVYPCNTCNSATSCRTCGYDVENRMNTANHCKCKSGFYEFLADKVCKPCILPCLTCSDLTTCITKYECDYQTSGLYLSGSECVPCEYPCKTCSSQTNCLSCGWDIENRNGPDHALECRCKDKFYQQGKACKPCILPCIKCTSESACTQYYDCNKSTSGLYPSGTECKECVHPCKTCNSPTHCYSCISPHRTGTDCRCQSTYYEFDQLCHKCIFPCLTCSDKHTCITWFDCNYNRSGQYKPSGNQCNYCQYPCLTCSSPTNCLTCNYDIENRNSATAGNECRCKNGFYDKNQRCVKCVLPCINCTAEDVCTSTFDCHTATSTVYKVSAAQGYCKQCVYPCRTCTSAGNCLSCGFDFENRKSAAHNCVCKDGYYERGQLCYKCIYPCNKCTSETNCIDYNYYTCDENISGTYYHNGQCHQCPYPCVTCNHATSCKTCGYEPTKRNSINDHCTCKHGYFLKGQECVSCKRPCTRCTSETACTKYTVQRHFDTTWYGRKRYKDSHTWYRVPLTCGDTSKNGWYKVVHYRDNTDNKNADVVSCHKCVYPCITCTNAHTCLTCQYDVENRHNNSACNCVAGYFEESNQCKKCVRPCEHCNSVTHCTRRFSCNNAATRTYHDGNICQACVFPCNTCNNPTSCITCGYKPDRRLGPTQNCACKSGFYTYGQECLPCIKPCITCSSATVCINMDCDSANTGLYKEGLVCKPCQYPCKTCMASPTNCYSCLNDVDKRINPDNINRSCDCIAGYFHDGETRSCVKCEFPCTKCVSLTECTEQDCFEATSGNYWDTSSKQCLQCTYPCKYCTGSPTGCLTCLTELHLRKDAPDCGCKDGYYYHYLEREHRCLKCPLPCKTCSNEATCITLDCNNDISGDYSLSDGGGLRCEKCPYPCATCEDQTAVCVTCGFQKVGRLNDGTCLCKPGYTEDPVTQACKRDDCDSPCVECDHSTGPISDFCSFCPKGFFPMWGACEVCPDDCTECDMFGTCIKCPLGYYLADGGWCQMCEKPCLNCIDATTCLSCLIDDVNFQNPAPTCSCKHGFSRIGDTCLSCTLPCLDCQDAVDQCTSCIVTYYRTDPSSPTSGCTECPIQCHDCESATICHSCSDGYYLSGTECLACVYPCKFCSGPDFCQSCADGVRLPVPSCKCVPPLYDNGEACITCVSPCLACGAENVHSCRSCVDGYYLIAGEECLEEPCPTDPAPPKCEQCPEGNARCESPTMALECLDGYYLDGEVCLKCVSPCETCLSATFCYSCGFDDGENPLRINPPTCACKEGFSDYGTHCDTCTAPCKTCNSAADNDCNSCIDPYYLSGNECLDCHESCSSCTGGADTDCVWCADGYYVNGSVCSACVYPCATCHTLNDCVTCSNDAAIRFAAPSCMCHHDKYDNGANCLDCPSPCRTCSLATTSDCLSCLDGYWLDGTECPACDEGCVTCLSNGSDCESCKDGWYLVGNECRKCSPLCKTCYDEHWCIECGVEPAKQIGPPHCNCPHGTSPWIAGGQCINCTPPCLTCTGPLANECLTCLDPYYLSGTDCLECDTGCASCDGEYNCFTCKDGYYLEGNSCLACVSPCARCLTATHCLECGHGPSLRENFPQCKCKPLYYDNTDECLACVSPCKECTTASDCTVCLPKHYLDGTSCLPCDSECKHCTGAADSCEDCEDTYYLDNNKCVACVYPCINCYGETQCLTCGYDANLRTAPPHCQCKHGTSDNGTTCVVCTEPCLTCNTVSDDDCITCIEGYKLVDGTTTCEVCATGCSTCKNAVDECYSCQDGYYLSGTECVICKHPCSKCYSDTECLDCVEDGESLRTDPPTCQCKSGYSDNGTICVECTSPCYTCNTVSSTDCLSCVQEHFIEGSECKPCDAGCLWCETSSDNCSECLDGYYLDGNTCIECPSPCTKCLTATFCVECGFGEENRLVPPTCQCKFGFKDVTTHCEPCPDGFDACNGLDISCSDEYFNNAGECEPCNTGCLKCSGTMENCYECIDTYYLDGTECKPCVAPCINCLNPTQCLSCGYGPADRILPPTCGCKQGLSDNGVLCIACTSPCKTCNSVSATDCITCIDKTFLQGTECLPCDTGCSLCEGAADTCSKCEDGYYLDGDKCEQCVSPCVKCVNATLCIECGYGPENRLTFPQCRCKQGFIDITSECAACTGDCRECNSASPTDCTECVMGKWLSGTECLDCAPGCIDCKGAADTCLQCEDGYYLDPSDSNCKPCVTPCVNCVSAEYCLTCETVNANRLPAPTCLCINGKSNIDGDCQDTPTPCADSTTSVNDSCLDCIIEYYLVGSECKPCNTGCRSCSGSPDNCIHCMTGYFKESDGKTCTQCRYPCVVCDYSPTHCLHCATFPPKGPGNGNRLPPPTCACERGYGEGGPTLGCIICNAPCALCNSYATDDCVSCIAEYYLAAGTTECRPCKPGCITCLESNINYCPNKCLPGYYFDSGATTCHKCPSRCGTCMNGSYCLTCGTSASKRIWQPSCVCKFGLHDNGVDCLSCQSPCKTCFEEQPDKCWSCVGTFYLSGELCVPCPTGCKTCVSNPGNCSACVDGYFHRGTECIKCVTPCATCLSETECLSCGFGQENRMLPPTCVCKAGLSDSGLACVVCTSPCVKCYSEADNDCITCIDEHYIDGRECKRCDAGCLKCDTTSDNCQSCIDGYYHDGGNTCIQCVSPCVNCLSATHCYSCGFGEENRINPPTCACKDGMSDRIDQCVVCIDPCLTCTRDDTNSCTSCVDKHYLVGTQCQTCKTGCNKCGPSDKNECQECLDGFFLHTDGETGFTTCKPCVTPCATCLNETHCYTCGYGAESRINPPTCGCIDGESDRLDQCVICTPPCRDCTRDNTNSCTTCIDDYYLVGTTCQQCKTGCKVCGPDDQNVCQECNDGFYLFTDPDTGISTCNPCISPCITCMSDTFCYTCGYGEENRIQPPTCGCIVGMSDRIDQCVNCVSPCFECTRDDTNSCTSCVDEYYLVGTQCQPCKTGCKTCGPDDENVCSDCIDGYYLFTDGEGVSTCNICKTPCATCLNDTFCYTCGYGAENRINPPTCACIDGESDRGDQCVICTPPCRNCFRDDTNSCTTCIDEFYLVGTQCQPCKTGCKVCGPDDKNVCEECIDGYYLYTDGEGVSTCNICKSPCVTCMSDTFCYTCGYGEELRIQPPTCACVEGYSDNRAMCVICDEPCLTCSDLGTNNCLTCIDEYYISGTQCVPCKTGCLECDVDDNTICSRCKDGFYHELKDDGETWTCTPCHTPCATCLTKTFCYTCAYGEDKRIQPPTCECTEEFSDSGAECITCNFPCKTCGATADTCITCTTEWYYDNDIMSCKKCLGCDLCNSPTTCENCLDGYYHVVTLDGEGNIEKQECYACEYPCKTCLDATYCYSCVDLSISDRVIPPTCWCKYPLSDGGLGIGCLLCLDPCETCRTTNSNDCITCIDKFYIGDDGETCEDCPTRCATCTSFESCQTCTEGNYLDGETCKPCVYPCATCMNPVYCYTCGYDIGKKNGPPLCDCKTDYSAGSDKCLECIAPCERCTGLALDQCITCIKGYYLVDTACINCPENYADCVSPTVGFECNPGWYIDGESCIPCNPPCKSCWNERDCYECISLDNRNIGPVCNCLDGYYDLGTECTLCPTPEKICLVPQDYINCVDGWYYELQYDRTWVLDPPKPEDYVVCDPPTETIFDLNTVPDGETSPYTDGETVEVDGEFTTTTTITTDGTNQKIVQQVCETKTRMIQPPEDGEWVDVPKNTCQPCKYPCKNCYSDTYCYECVDGEYRDYAPLCECDVGYYDDGTECLQCPHPAATCTTATNFYSCKDGWFMQYNDCIECLYPCVTCVRQYVCLTCGWDVANRYGTPNCNCKDTLYNDGESQSCKQCPLPSHTCLSPTEFTSCKDEWFLRDSNCLACVYPCKTCESETYCLTCGYDVANKEPNQTCACRYGDYYQDGEYDGIRCSICESPCHKCIGKTDCLSCLPGWTLEGYHCRPCNYPCVTCLGDFCLNCGMDVENTRTPSCNCILQVGDSGTYQECFEEGCPIYACIPPCKNCKSEVECTECLDPYNRKDVPDCNCKDGYELNLNDQCVLPCSESGTYGTVDGECLPCVDPCSECSGDPDKCTDCIFGYKLYENNECKMVCVYPCRTCTTSTECITCSGLYRDDTRNCACSDGYYEVGDECLICQAPCKHCQDAYTCDTCIEDDGESPDGENAWNREGPDLNCKCLPDYSPFEGKCIPKCEDGQFNYGMICLECNPNCKTCFGQGAACTSCADQYYYEDNKCLPCGKYCKQCTQGDGECSECDPTAVGREQVLPYCKCKSGFFERGTSDCGVCINPCVTCEGTRNHCLECVEGGLNRNDAPDCNCKDGFYLKDGTCKECSYKCHTCNIQPDGCITCHQDAIGRDKEIGVTNPECKCLDGYFDAGEKDCHECVYPCAKCVGENDYCLECVFPLEDRKDAPNCNCADGTYGDPTGHCQTCGLLCATCVTDRDNCIECDGENRTAPECLCKENYFSVTIDSECLQCESPCWNCENTASYCKDCIAGPFRLDPPLCTCEPGYFENDAFACLKCSHPCFECVGNSTNCLSCAQDSDPNRFGLDKDCKCHDGFYSNGRSCAACHEGCLTCEFEATNCIDFRDGFFVGGGKCEPQCKLCTGSVDNCIVCALDYGRVMIPPLCECASGMYAVQGELSCYDCPQQCNTCRNANTCITCKNPLFMPPLCKSAKQGNFLETDLGGSLIVGECDPKCDACTESQNLCSVCSKGRHRRQLPPHCECEYGFHDNYGKDFNCSPCPKECKSCNSFNECTECKDNQNRELDIFGGGCGCIKGYKEFENNLKCEKCYQYQDECVLFCPENTVQDEQNSVCVEKNMHMMDNIKLIQYMAGFILFSLFAISIFFMSSLSKSMKRLRRFFLLRDRRQQNKDNIRRKLKGSSEGSNSSQSDLDNGGQLLCNNDDNSRINNDQSQILQSEANIILDNSSDEADQDAAGNNKKRLRSGKPSIIWHNFLRQIKVFNNNNLENGKPQKKGPWK